MSLAHLDKQLIRKYLSEVWKKQLKTRQDPANRRWYETGANHDGIGLYGGLTDDASTELIFDEAQKSYVPQDVICDNVGCDNRDWPEPQEMVAELTYTKATSTSVSHSTTDAIKAGVGLEFKAKATIFGIGGEATTKFSLEFTHSWTDSKSETASESDAIKESLRVLVPARKWYRVELVATSQTLVIPYRALIYVRGATETWFEDRVAGHYNYMMTAGEAFTKIAQWGIAGADSHCYGADPRNPSVGVITQYGKVTAQRSTNVRARKYDITDTGDGVSGLPSVGVSLGRAATTGRLIEEIPLGELAAV
jgi:hypothetical protein